MSNNSSINSSLGNPNDAWNNSSSFQSLEATLISFVAIGAIFIAVCSFRCFTQQREIRSSSLQKQPNNGLNSTSISSLPSFPYKRCEHNSSMECSICLSSVEEGEIVRVLLKCMHSFHATCVELWLQGHTTCPVCRMEVLDEVRNVIVDPPTLIEMV